MPLYFLGIINMEMEEKYEENGVHSQKLHHIAVVKHSSNYTK